MCGAWEAVKRCRSSAGQPADERLEMSIRYGLGVVHVGSEWRQSGEGQGVEMTALLGVCVAATEPCATLVTGRTTPVGR